MTMSNKGKQKLPEWVQQTVQKSKLGFNMVHEELKRMYNESLKVVVNPETKETVDSVVTKRKGVVNRLAGFIGSLKSRYQAKSVSSQSEATDSIRHLANKTGNVADTERHENNKTTGRKHEGTMPHSEFLKSHVNTNDRVVHELVDGEPKQLSNESLELYAEINDYTPDGSSDSAESESQSLLAFESSKYNTMPNSSNYCPLNVDSRCVNTNEYMPMKGVTRFTACRNRSFRLKSIEDHRRCDGNRISTASTQYANTSKSLSSNLNYCCENLNKIDSKHRRIAPCRSNDARTSSQHRCKTNGTEKSSQIRTVKPVQRIEVVPENHETNQSHEVRSFYDHTVEEVADCLRKCAFIGLAQVCLDEQLDGEYFRGIKHNDLKQEPFNMNWFHITKLLKVIHGWRPKNSQRLDS